MSGCRCGQRHAGEEQDLTREELHLSLVGGAWRTLERLPKEVMF